MKTSYLVVKEGSSSGRKYPLKDGFFIGRELQNDLVVQDQRASRRHAKIEFRKDGIYLVDQQSANKTYVNGSTISEKKLERGDIIRIATFLFSYVEEDESTRPKAAESQVLMLNQMKEMTSFQEVRSVKGHSIDDLVKMSKDPQSDRVANILLSLFDVSKKLNTIYDIDELLSGIFDVIFKTLPSAERGFIMLPDADGKMVERFVKSRKGSTAIHASSTVIDRTTQKREAILSTNTLDDEDLKCGASIISENIRSVLCVPMLRTTENSEEMLGLIYLDTTRLDVPFDKIDLSILTAVAGQAAVAIKNAQLVDEVKHSTELRTSLQRYLSPSVVEQVISRQIKIGLGGEIVPGSVLFADLDGFTTIAESMEPDPLVKMLNRYFNRMVELIFENQGTVDKFGGDSVLSVWGAPRQMPDYAFLACKAAIEMQNALFELNLTESWKHFLMSGTGITTGKFLAGNLGSEQRMEYTIIGHTVNLAQRLETLAPSNTILINDETLEAIGKPVATITFQPIMLKGVSKPISIHSLRGYCESSDPFRAILMIPVLIEGGGASCRGRLLCYYTDRETRHFVNVMCEGDIGPHDEFIIRPNILETNVLGPLHGTLADVDTGVIISFGAQKGRVFRLDMEKSDPATLRFISCAERLDTSVNLETLKEYGRKLLQG